VIGHRSHPRRSGKQGSLSVSWMADHVRLELRVFDIGREIWLASLTFANPHSVFHATIPAIHWPSKARPVHRFTWASSKGTLRARSVKSGCEINLSRAPSGGAPSPGEADKRQQGRALDNRSLLLLFALTHSLHLIPLSQSHCAGFRRDVRARARPLTNDCHGPWPCNHTIPRRFYALSPFAAALSS